jgi:alkylation response protein AidB-like acyl-CoA dehydrogenase
VSTLRQETGIEREWERIARDMAPVLAARASEIDMHGRFVEENYRDLRERELFWMGIPRELGGGGAPYPVLCDTIREIGRQCGSTALAFAMHSHPVAANVFKYLHGDAAAERTLRKIVTGRLVIAGTGANDWLESSGRAVRVEGGYSVRAEKRFVSGAPGAQVFVTSVRHDSEVGPEVLHFSIPFSGDGVMIVPTWEALGMRGTGSHDVSLRDVFVPDEAIITRRPAGVWHPLWDVVVPIALPLITSCYVGLAERAVELGMQAAARTGESLASVVGEMTNALTVAQLALDDMIRVNAGYRFKPGLGTTSSILARKAIATNGVKQAAELAAELVGGPGFLKGSPMERIIRDVRAMHFHPLPARRQQDFSGRVAMGLDPVH